MLQRGRWGHRPLHIVGGPGPYDYWTSCSRSSKIGVSKNSRREMSSPSQSFLMVDTVALWFRPLTMLLRVDWVTPLRVASRLMVIFRWVQSSKILERTAI